MDGCVDAYMVARKFRYHFAKAYSCNSAGRVEQLKNEYQSLRGKYCGMPVSNVLTFDTDLVSHIIADLKRGKAAGIDGLSAEQHLLFCPSAVCVVLAKLLSRHRWFPIQLYCADI